MSLLCGHSVPYSETWPTSGTTRRGLAYPLPTPVPRTAGSASSSWRVMPTPRSQNGEGRNQNIYARPLDQPQNLENALAMLPTPRATDETKGGPNQRGSSGDLMLPSAVQSIGAPTPPPSPDGSES